MSYTVIILSVLSVCAIGQEDAEDVTVIKGKQMTFNGNDYAKFQLSEWVSFSDITVCGWIKPNKDVITIFSFSTDDDINYLYLTIDIAKQSAKFVYALEEINLKFSGIKLEVWSHFCVTTEHRDKPEGQISIYLNNSQTDSVTYKQFEETGVEGMFVVGQKKADSMDDDVWEAGLGMDGNIFSLQVWSQAESEVFDEQTMGKYYYGSCNQNPGNVVNWQELEEWDVSRPSFKKRQLTCKAKPKPGVVTLGSGVSRKAVQGKIKGAMTGIIGA